MINHILILVYIVIAAFFNVYAIKDMKSTVYSFAFHTLQAICFLIAVYLAFGFTIVFLQACVARWILHDAIINIGRGYPLLYVGYASSIDKFYRKITNKPETLLILTKIILLCLLSSEKFYPPLL